MWYKERMSIRRAKELRSRMPDAEVILWSRLRHMHQIGIRFRRQHPIGRFIADFACISQKLVLEVDGGTHCTDAERAYDARREAYLRARGWRILRVTNWEVYHHLNEVMETISRLAPPPPHARSARSAPPP
jgi:very-short-patch-repair endonuclease